MVPHQLLLERELEAGIHIVVDLDARGTGIDSASPSPQLAPHGSIRSATRCRAAPPITPSPSATLLQHGRVVQAGPLGPQSLTTNRITPWWRELLFRVGELWWFVSFVVFGGCWCRRC